MVGLEANTNGDRERRAGSVSRLIAADSGPAVSFPGALARAEEALKTALDPTAAGAMARYMRDQFRFLGVKTPQRRSLLRTAMRGSPRPSEVELEAAARHLWTLEEREFQYVGCDLLAKHWDLCGPNFLAVSYELITAKSWWDTVDSIAVHLVGPLVRRYAELIREMDTWIGSGNLWVRRTAILYQVGAKGAVDRDRLFGYALRCGHERAFFIQKAIGWALRDYSWTDWDDVARFVSEHASELSPLTQREALLRMKRKGRPGTATS